MRYSDKSSKNMLILTAVYVAFLLAIPIALSPEKTKWMLSETGPIEILSIFAWLVLAAQFAFSAFRPTVKWPMALLFAGFAAREADLHKAFTAEGMMKINYYTRSSAPLGEKLISGMIALVFVGVLLYSAFLFIRFLFARSAWRSQAGRWLIFAGFLFAVCKVLDRLPNILLEKHGIALPPLLDLYFASLEEGMELWVPIVLIWLAWTRKKEFKAFG